MMICIENKFCYSIYSSFGGARGNSINMSGKIVQKPLSDIISNDFNEISNLIKNFYHVLQFIALNDDCSTFSIDDINDCLKSHSFTVFGLKQNVCMDKLSVHTIDMIKSR